MLESLVKKGARDLEGELVRKQSSFSLLIERLNLADKTSSSVLPVGLGVTGGGGGMALDSAASFWGPSSAGEGDSPTLPRPPGLLVLERSVTLSGRASFNGSSRAGSVPWSLETAWSTLPSVDNVLADSRESRMSWRLKFWIPLARQVRELSLILLGAWVPASDCKDWAPRSLFRLGLAVLEVLVELRAQCFVPFCLGGSSSSTAA